MALRSIFLSAGVGAATVVLLHGWPDSFLRFERVLPLLTDINVVVPCLPGYPYAEPAPATGMSATAMADVVAGSLAELGVERYVVSGGDVGGLVAEAMARHHPEQVAALHLTDLPYLHLFPLDPDELSAPERQYLADGRAWQQAEGGYALLQIASASGLRVSRPFARTADRSRCPPAAGSSRHVECDARAGEQHQPNPIHPVPAGSERRSLPGQGTAFEQRHVDRGDQEARQSRGRPGQSCPRTGPPSERSRFRRRSGYRRRSQHKRGHWHVVPRRAAPSEHSHAGLPGEPFGQPDHVLEDAHRQPLRVGQPRDCQPLRCHVSLLSSLCRGGLQGFARMRALRSGYAICRD